MSHLMNHRAIKIDLNTPQKKFIFLFYCVIIFRRIEIIEILHYARSLKLTDTIQSTLADYSEN